MIIATDGDMVNLKKKQDFWYKEVCIFALLVGIMILHTVVCRCFLKTF